MAAWNNNRRVDSTRATHSDSSRPAPAVGRSRYGPTHKLDSERVTLPAGVRNLGPSLSATRRASAEDERYATSRLRDSCSTRTETNNVTQSSGWRKRTISVSDAEQSNHKSARSAFARELEQARQGRYKDVNLNELRRLNKVDQQLAEELFADVEKARAAKAEAWNSRDKDALEKEIRRKRAEALELVERIADREDREPRLRQQVTAEDGEEPPCMELTGDGYLAQTSSPENVGDIPWEQPMDAHELDAIDYSAVVDHGSEVLHDTVEMVEQVPEENFVEHVLEENYAEELVEENYAEEQVEENYAEEQVEENHADEEEEHTDAMADPVVFDPDAWWDDDCEAEGEARAEGSGARRAKDEKHDNGDREIEAGARDAAVDNKGISFARRIATSRTHTQSRKHPDREDARIPDSECDVIDYGRILSAIPKAPGIPAIRSNAAYPQPAIRRTKPPATLTAVRIPPTDSRRDSRSMPSDSRRDTRFATNGSTTDRVESSASDQVLSVSKFCSGESQMQLATQGVSMPPPQRVRDFVAKWGKEHGATMLTQVRKRVDTIDGIEQKLEEARSNGNLDSRGPTHADSTGGADDVKVLRMRDVKCQTCGGMGHFYDDCPESKKGKGKGQGKKGDGARAKKGKGAAKGGGEEKGNGRGKDDGRGKGGGRAKGEGKNGCAGSERERRAIGAPL